MKDASGHTRWGDIEHDELEESVVDEDAITHVHVVGEPFVRDRQLAVADGMLWREHHVRAVRQRERRGQLTDANPRPLQVAKNRDRAADGFGRLAHERHRRRVLLV